MITVLDQLGQALTFTSHPSRIVSLVPSQTELLVDLRLRESILGITKFCVHPSNLKAEKTILGGTKSVNIEKLKALQPDIILCNKEENTKEMVCELQKIAPVHISDIKTIEDTQEMIAQYGVLFNRELEAAKISNEIQKAFIGFKEEIKNYPVRTCAYFIWKDPWMAVGGDTFINHLLEINRFKNIFKSKSRYPETKLEAINNVDVVLLSSEPYPFKEKHIAEIKLNHPVTNEIVLVNGEYFSWYGSRLLQAFDYLLMLRQQLKL